MQRIRAIQNAVFTVSLYLFVSVLPASAQQDALWQGPRIQQSSPSTPQAPPPSSALQQSLPAETQAPGKGHPQVMEMPAAQAPSPAATQAEPSSPQPAAVAYPAQPSAKPAYLGITGNTALACRYPAGVRISQVIEGSPAHQAGLKGEGTLSWKQAVAGLLALSPAALLISPFLKGGAHGGPGDLILAVDGERVHNREEFEQEMRRFQPGDVIYFSVLRGEGRLRQIPVRLTEYPDSAPAMQEASLTPALPGS